ncbi:MAG: hypothetical protein ACRD0A_15230 [Acidimicrobiales bacterium]
MTYGLDLPGRRRWVGAAVRSFEDALTRSLDGVGEAGDPVVAGRRAAATALAGALWSERLGPVHDTAGAAAILGGITKQAVSERARRHRLLALRTGSGRLVYPAFQFNGNDVLPGVVDVLAVARPDPVTAWTVASWLTTPDPVLGGRTPVAALRDGDADAVLVAARDMADGLADGGA